MYTPGGVNLTKKKEEQQEEIILPEPVDFLSGLDEIKNDLIIRSKKGTITYGIEILDDCVEFIRPCTMTLIAACPNVGKSLLAQNMACHIAKQGKKVLFCSCEMTVGLLMERQLKQLMNLTSTQMMSMYEHSPSLLDDQFDIVRTDSEYEYIHRIKVLDIGGMHVDTLLKVLDKYNDYEYVIVDYIQRLHGEGPSKYEKLADVSYKLQIYAMQHDRAMIVCAQIPKTVEIDARGEKKGIDFNAMRVKGAGEMEEDAHVAIKMIEEYKEGKKYVLINLSKSKYGDKKLLTYRYKISPRLTFDLIEKDI